MEEWIPKTDLGKRVKSRQITDINEILDNGHIILEPQITDTLLPEMENDLLLVGQSKGKFGGGRRRVFRQTQKKTREGNKPRFAAYAVVGNGDGIVGLGYGKARETVPARDKAIRKAKLNMFKIARGSGSWEGTVDEPHTVPFTVEGKCGSVIVRLKPAPKGKGLVAEKEVQKILRAAGVEDVWSESFGQTKNKINLIKATEQALRKLSTTKLRPQDVQRLSVVYGNTKPIAIAAKKESSAPERPAKEAKPKNPVVEVPDNTAEQAENKPLKGAVTPLENVSGIGSSTADTLREAGFDSAEKIAAADEKTLSDLDGIGKATAKKLLSAAQEAIQ